MNVNVEKKSKEQMMSMSIEDIEKIVEISGVGLIVDNGEVSAISVGDEEIFNERESNPITATLAMALEEVYGKLADAKMIIDKLVDYVFDNILSVEENKDTAIEKISELFKDMGLDADAVEDLSHNLSSLLKENLDYEAFARHCADPEEDLEI